MGLLDEVAKGTPLGRLVASGAEVKSSIDLEKAEQRPLTQEFLTKEQALQSLLENNYNVKLSKNNLDIAENNTSILNSGY